jgi:hypothetical protein
MTAPSGLDSTIGENPIKYFWPACVALLLASTAIAQNQFVYTNNNVFTGINKRPVNRRLRIQN